jgi:hypothetical protein
MMPGATMTWTTDGSVTAGGFTVCGAVSAIPPAPPPPLMPPPPAPHPPPPGPPLDHPLWQIVTGSDVCELTQGGRYET